MRCRFDARRGERVEEEGEGAFRPRASSPYSPSKRFQSASRSVRKAAAEAAEQGVRLRTMKGPRSVGRSHHVSEW